MPHNCRDFNPWTIRRVTLYEFTWLFYIIESPDRNIRAWHDSNTLQILPEINIGVQDIRYTSEYILKLQIHQHSLLTSKVFSRHNLSAQVFFSVSSESSSSSRHLHLQSIFFFNSSSSLDLDHQSIWIIITGSGSSLDLDHHWTSSLDLDHHSIWIITPGSSSLNHHRWYLLILLITGSSTEPTLFHAGYRPSLLVGLL